MSDFDATIQAQLHREADRMSDPQPLTPRSKRRIRLRQTIVAATATVSVVAMIAGGVYLSQKESSAPERVASESINENGGTDGFGDISTITRHQTDGSVCIEVEVDEELNPCLFLSAVGKGLEVGGYVSPTKGPYLVARGPGTIDLAFDHPIKKMSVSEDPHEDDALTVAFFTRNYILAGAWEIDGDVANRLFEFQFGTQGFRIHPSGADQRKLSFDFQLDFCPRLMPTDEASTDSARVAFLLWAGDHIDRGAVGFDEVRVRYSDAGVWEGCPGWVKKRTFKGRLRPTYDEAADVPGVFLRTYKEVLIGRTLDGWKVWRLNY